MDSDQFKLKFFDYSLRGKAKKWFHSLPLYKKDTWDNCKNSFLVEFFFKELDFDNCSISEVIKFLQIMAKDPHTSSLNIAFTEHITNALIKAREEKLKLEVSIPRKLEDGWDPMVKIKLNNFSCFALCDVGASASVWPKRMYDMLELKPFDPCSLGVRLVYSSIKKPLGRIDDVLILVNDNYVPVDFLVMDNECDPSCPIILGRPFLRTVGAIIDMKEGIIRFPFPPRRAWNISLERR